MHVSFSKGLMKSLLSLFLDIEYKGLYYRYKKTKLYKIIAKRQHFTSFNACTSVTSDAFSCLEMTQQEENNDFEKQFCLHSTVELNRTTTTTAKTHEWTKCNQNLIKSCQPVWKSIFKRLPLEGLISNAFFFDAISFNYMYETHSSLIS